MSYCRTNIEHSQGRRGLWSILRVGNLNWNQGLAIEMQLHLCLNIAALASDHTGCLLAVLDCGYIRQMDPPLLQHRGILATGAMDLGEMQLDL